MCKDDTGFLNGGWFGNFKRIDYVLLVLKPLTQLIRAIIDCMYSWYVDSQ